MATDDVKALVEAFCEDVEIEVARRARGPGGQSVTPVGDWINAPPTTMRHLTRWARSFRTALAAVEREPVGLGVAPGDRLRCVEGDSALGVERGQHYIVERVDHGGGIKVVGNEAWLHPSRFVRAAGAAK